MKKMPNIHINVKWMETISPIAPRILTFERVQCPYQKEKPTKSNTSIY